MAKFDYSKYTLDDLRGWYEVCGKTRELWKYAREHGISFIDTKALLNESGCHLCDTAGFDETGTHCQICPWMLFEQQRCELSSAYNDFKWETKGYEIPIARLTLWRCRLKAEIRRREENNDPKTKNESPRRSSRRALARN